jgi:hypothetical protein
VQTICCASSATTPRTAPSTCSATVCAEERPRHAWRPLAQPLRGTALMNPACRNARRRGSSAGRVPPR